MIGAVQSDLNASDDSPLFTLAKVKSAINRAYVKCGGLFRWPATEDAKKTSTQANIEYYDYPQNWRDDSLWKIAINDEAWGEEPDGSPLPFDDYLVWRLDPLNANSTERKWSTQKRRFFIWPIPTTAGSYNICAWGQKIVTAMSANTDYTIFSYSMPEGNEAVVLEADAILKSKGEEEKTGAFRSTEAKQILVVAWNKIREDQTKYEPNKSFFYVPNMFGNTASTKLKIGNF